MIIVKKNACVGSAERSTYRQRKTSSHTYILFILHSVKQTGKYILVRWSQIRQCRQNHLQTNRYADKSGMEM